MKRGELTLDTDQGDVAQLAERSLRMREVRGSKPCVSNYLLLFVCEPPRRATRAYYVQGQCGPAIVLVFLRAFRRPRKSERWRTTTPRAGAPRSSRGSATSARAPASRSRARPPERASTAAASSRRAT
eukprot:29833-Pelagococcus_subviridis.AAC.12